MEKKDRAVGSLFYDHVVTDLQTVDITRITKYLRSLLASLFLLSNPTPPQKRKENKTCQHSTAIGLAENYYTPFTISTPKYHSSFSQTQTRPLSLELFIKLPPLSLSVTARSCQSCFTNIAVSDEIIILSSPTFSQTKNPSTFALIRSFLFFILEYLPAGLAGIHSITFFGSARVQVEVILRTKKNLK